MRVLVLWVGLLAGMASAQDFGRTRSVPAPTAAARVEANAALEARDYDKAVRLLKPLAEAAPNDAPLLFDLGTAEDALDQASPAEASYRASIAADPKPLEPHLALGLLLARAGRFDDARAELHTAVALPEGDPLLKARAYRALARLDQKTRPVEARDELIEALKLSPETPEDSTLAAELAEDVGGGGPEAAEAALRRTLAARSGDPEATASLAHLLVTTKRLPEAETLLRGALDKHPGDPVLTAQLATLLNTESKPGEALPLAAELHKVHPDDPNVTHLLAALDAETGDYAAAEPLFRALAAQTPADVGLQVEHANTLVYLKRFVEAETILARAVAEPSRFRSPEELGDAAGRLAFTCSENNDPAGALRAIAVRGTVLPSSPAILFLAAISEDKLHQIKQARQAYQAFLAASKGALPNEEFEARHRLVALEHMK